MKFPIGHYDNDQINVLQTALDLACKELRIGRADHESRHRVASMMIAFAKHGSIEVEKLQAFAVQQFDKLSTGSTYAP
jgi:hypothetical protein